MRKSIAYLSIAKQIWDNLANRYYQSNVPRLFHLRKELTSLTQGSNSVTTYFTQFRGLSDELENPSPIPRCQCTTEHSLKLDQYEQQIKLSQFPMGLNNQFTSTRGQILLMSPLPDITHAYAKLLQEENQRANHSNSVPMYENTAMNVMFNVKNKSPNQRKEDKIIH